jgi:hypothetical protein
VDDPFERALRDEAELAEIYPPPEDSAVRKDVGRIDALCERLIAASHVERRQVESLRDRLA